LKFNSTFSTIKPYRAFRSYTLVYVLENGSTLGVLYISYSAVDVTSRWNSVSASDRQLTG